MNATANAGYRFVNWTEGATIVGTRSSYSFSATTQGAGGKLCCKLNDTVYAGEQAVRA